MKHAIAAAAALLVCAAPAFAQETVTVAWDPSPEADVAGYTLLAGTAPGVYTATQWVGNVTERTMTLPAGTYYFAVRATNRFGLESEPSEEISRTVAVDARAPVITWQALWQHRGTGQIVWWDMFSDTFGSGGALGPGSVPVGWTIRGTADLNGDGERDLLFQHEDGTIATWLMNGTAMIESRVVSRVSDKNWQVAAVADFNGDSHSDFLFRRQDTGDLVVWTMEGLTVSGGAALSAPPVPDVNWTIVAATDVNGDSKPDILWQNRKTGVITSWLMDGTSFITAGPFTVGGASDTRWHLTGVADIDGDGDADLLWQHASTNHIAAWFMDGRKYIDARVLTPGQVPAGWSLFGGR